LVLPPFGIFSLRFFEKENLIWNVALGRVTQFWTQVPVPHDGPASRSPRRAANLFDAGWGGRAMVKCVVRRIFGMKLTLLMQRNAGKPFCMAFGLEL
jgi:hypothetical protein